MLKRYTVLLVTMILLVILTACGSNRGDEAGTADQNAENPVAISNDIGTANGGDASSEDENATRTYIDKYGEVTIPAHPKKLLVTNTRYAEFLITLGVDPDILLYMPALEPDYREVMFKEHNLQLVEYPQYEHNFELLLTLDADLIIAVGASTEKNIYDQLSKIAPTVALDAGISMDESMPLLAELFGKQEEYKSVMAEFESEIAKVRDEISEVIGDKNVMVLRVDPKQYRYLGQHTVDVGSSRLFYHSLGLNIPPALADGPEWFNSFSLEILPEIDPDYIFIERRVMADSESTDSWGDLLDSKIWQNLRAVKEGKVIQIATKDLIQGEGPVGHIHLSNFILESLKGK